MMDNFMRFFNEQKGKHSLLLNLTYSKFSDWELELLTSKRSTENHECLTIFHIQNPDLQYVFARALVALIDYLLDYEGGY